MKQTIVLLGDPVAHSRSPAIHNAAFAHLGLELHYRTWHTPGAELAARMTALREPDMLGANVTLPHKAAVLSLLDSLEPEAALIGAVNTIYKGVDGELVGANTDAPALLEALDQEGGYDPRGQAVLILGASGAARAAAYALVGAGAEQLVVVNRTLARAEDLLGELLASCDHDPRLLACTPDDEDLPALLSSSTLIVNATSLGWHDDETPLAAELIPAGALVYDMVYRPTRLLRDASARGARPLGGMGMLLRQAALAFTRWTGQPAPLEVMRAAVEDRN